MHQSFHQYSEPTPEILDLLDRTVLGSNGARYRHADTLEHIREIDNPMYLTLERNKKVLGNITFCKRGLDWYIRYFAFASTVQSNNPKRKKSNSVFKAQLNEFFKSQLRSQNFRSFYAYIDPRNSRSKHMALDFGFEKKGEIITQTYSRLFPKKSNRLVPIERFDQIEAKFEREWNHLPYFFDAQVKKGKFYGIQDEHKELLAIVNTHQAHWEWERLPGKNGQLLTKIIPFVPLLRRLIHPKDHRFVVIDSLWVRNDNETLLKELLDAVLHAEGRNSILWWVDPNNRLYQKVKDKKLWGPMDRLNGRHPVDLMVRSNDPTFPQGEIYVNGLDFI